MKVASTLKVKVRDAGTFGEAMPPEARDLLATAKFHGWPSLEFAVPALSPSVNKMYTQVSYDKRVLSAENVTFRQMVALAIGGKRHAWKPTGAITMLVFLMQPYWLKKDLTIRQADADNRIKPLQDAIEIVTGVPDETTWSLHAFKIVTKSEIKTLVWLFDRGIEVDVYS